MAFQTIGGLRVGVQHQADIAWRVGQVEGIASRADAGTLAQLRLLGVYAYEPHGVGLHLVAVFPVGFFADDGGQATALTQHPDGVAGVALYVGRKVGMLYVSYAVDLQIDIGLYFFTLLLIEAE